MGLKSGSRDAGLDDSDDEERTEEDPSHDAVDADRTDHERGTADTDSTADQSTATETQRPSVDSLPYTLRRDKVNENREQVPYFLRDSVLQSETELQDTLEDMLDETVYKSDYREASMVVAQRHPELVAEVLREWGYDLE